MVLGNTGGRELFTKGENSRKEASIPRARHSAAVEGERGCLGWLILHSAACPRTVQ